MADESVDGMPGEVDRLKNQNKKVGKFGYKCSTNNDQSTFLHPFNNERKIQRRDFSCLSDGIRTLHKEDIKLERRMIDTMQRQEKKEKFLHK